MSSWALVMLETVLDDGERTRECRGAKPLHFICFIKKEKENPIPTYWLRLNVKCLLTRPNNLINKQTNLKAWVLFLWSNLMICSISSSVPIFCTGKYQTQKNLEWELASKTVCWGLSDATVASAATRRLGLWNLDSWPCPNKGKPSWADLPRVTVVCSTLCTKKTGSPKVKEYKRYFI